MRRPSLLLAALLVCTAPALALDLYVAQDGDDTLSGTAPSRAATGPDGPFATLTRARDWVRELRKAAPLAEPVTIHVRAGLYPLKDTFKLEAADSGTAEAPMVYRGYQTERPILTGGLPVNDFTPHQGKILKADLTASGLKGVALRQLLFHGARQPLARYPNFDPAESVRRRLGLRRWRDVADVRGERGRGSHTLLVKPQDWRTWARPEDVEVFIFPRYNWWNDILRVKRGRCGESARSPPPRTPAMRCARTIATTSKTRSRSSMRPASGTSIELARTALFLAAGAASRAGPCYAPTAHAISWSFEGADPT